MESYFGAICGDATAADEVDDPDEAQPPTLSAAVINAMQVRGAREECFDVRSRAARSSRRHQS